MIPLAAPDLSGNEARYLRECIESGYVSAGPFVERFENAMASTLGVDHAVGCASGTAALHVALRLMGAGPGRLVAVSDFTFIASANAVRYTGADVLLVDSEPQTWNMDTELLHDEVVRRARTGQRLPDIVEVVHVLGHPAAMEPLIDLKNRFGIRIVEDAAESLGASWKTGEQVGTVGDIGCFSFNGNKMITTGNGGLIVTNDAAIAEQARHLINQAKVTSDEYVHDAVGYNYRLSNVSAAIGLAQWERLEEIRDAKVRIAGRYQRWLESAPVRSQPHAEWANPSHWLYSLTVQSIPPTIESIISLGSEQEIQFRRLWPPLHQQGPYLSSETIGGAVAAGIYHRGISLPSSADLTIESQRKVCTALVEATASVRSPQ
ncbi:aminotransferase class I/II-fold pyridoxal phosphate-dependent enzyme [Saccharomonospora sp. NPDC046836]|uniref:aminotransferase class I/II-fold pyridoxal phosphate-dependent enzyme n=1 Tax=Saccharomonospora sp. NPDC046836 TaxID=3156921 RepID=UPI0033D11EF5